MTIQDLLARAAELAPEWCRIDPEPGVVAFIRHDDLSVYVDPLDDADLAAILYAVLKECERRGWKITVTCMPYPDRTHKWVAYRSMRGKRHQASDPATAALAAFVAMLEQAKEVTK